MTDQRQHERRVSILRPRENWYRDVWLFVLSLLLVVTMWAGFTQNRQSRRDSIIVACQVQNERHDHTLNKLEEQIEMLPPEQRARAEASKRYTVALIESIVPFEDCGNRAELLVPHEWYEF